MPNKNLVVFYHSPCMDGYAAACAFFDQVNEKEWDSINYLGFNYGQMAELKYMVGNNPLAGATHVLCLDICPTPDVLDYMLVDRGLNVCVLDHHDTAMDNLEYYNKSGILFTVAKYYSGASLVKALGTSVNLLFQHDTYETSYIDDEDILTNNQAYIYLNRKLVEGNELYRLLEIRDLWIQDDPEAKKLADDLAAYFKANSTYKEPVRSVAALELIVDEALVEGRKLNAEHELIINAAIAAGVTYQLEYEGESLDLLITECPNDLSSMLGGTYNDSCKGNSLAIGVYRDGPHIAGLSLRSKGNFGLARLVAEHLGGGGHDHASGARIKPGSVLDHTSLFDKVKLALNI